MTRVYIAAVFAVCVWLVPASTSQCPSHCMCGLSHMVKGSMQPTRAECTVIPSELPLSVIMLKVSDIAVPNITQATLSGVISLLVDVKLESLHIEYIEDGAFQNAINIRKLMLSKNNLKVVTANTFASCTTIVELYLQDNELYFIDDNAFVNLLNLKELYMQRNKLTSLPSHLPPNLVKLDLSVNEIGPVVTSMSDLTHLNLLNLCGNPMHNISLDTLVSLDSLEHLCLGGDGVGLPQFAADHLPMLKDLSLTSTTATELNEITIQELAQLKNIKILDISNYHISSFKFLDELTNIRKIQLTKVTIGNQAGQEFVESLPKLIFLANIQLDESPQLANVFIGNAHKFEIRYLHTLSLRHNGLTSVHPTSIPRLDLPYLDISDNPFHCNCSLKWLQDAHDLQNKHNTLCATPEAQRGLLVTNFIRELNCTAEDLMPGHNEDAYPSSHHGEDDADNTATHIIIGCVIATVIIVIIASAVIYVLYKKRQDNKITPDTEMQHQQQQVQSITEAHSNDHLLKK